MRKIKCLILATVLFFSQGIVPVMAAETTSKVGIHILSTDELDSAKELVGSSSDPESWQYVTIPFTLADLDQPQRWQTFFHQAKEARIIPLVRLTTRFENGTWAIPDRKEIVDQIDFLSALEWPTQQRHLIMYNEVNHAKEWGGQISPEEYAGTLRFASNWAHAENKDFVVLPAAMDLAAPNSSATMEAFTYLNKMYEYDNEIFSYVDVWNSHSYPNPAFSSSPERIGQNSLSGFMHELSYLKEKTGHDYLVYITETGWQSSSGLDRWLTSYYEYALQHVWSHSQVVAVTPFILKGAPGPFANFSFIDAADQPTAQYKALQAAMRKVWGDSSEISLVQ